MNVIKIGIRKRDSYDLRDKTKELEEKSIRRKKRVFVDMDNVLVDFQSGLDLQSEDIKKEYAGRLDEIPGLFAEMKPIPGAIEAMHTLQEHSTCTYCLQLLGKIRQHGLTK